MPDETIIIKVDKLVLNANQEPVKDMLDVQPGTKIDSLKELTLGSLIANALYVGITGAKPKEAMKYFEMAGKIEEALQPKNEGKWVVGRSELDQLAEAWGKINVSAFTIPMYAGLVQKTLDDAQVELLAKERAVKDKPSVTPK